jgi:phage baseplate assembly protein W
MLCLRVHVHCKPSAFQLEPSAPPTSSARPSFGSRLDELVSSAVDSERAASSAVSVAVRETVQIFY